MLALIRLAIVVARIQYCCQIACKMYWRIFITDLLSCVCYSRIKFPITEKKEKGKKRKANEESEPKQEDKTLVIEPYVTPNRGPYPYNQPKR